jgi:hypothetical protein
MTPPVSLQASPCPLNGLAWLSQAYKREPLLAAFGLFWWACLVPLIIAYSLDDRSLRGANIWLKPIKFALSLGLYSLYTAWFIGLLQPDRRQSKAVQYVVWGIIGAGTFENVYITLQAALGQASHFNKTDMFHGVMFTLMGLGALMLTSTQAVLAVQVHRHAQATVPSNLRQSVVLGLAMTFVLGTIAGASLGGIQPPEGQGIALLGWHMSGGDIRPAHFMGIHAQQLFPLAAWGMAAIGFARIHSGMKAFTVAYVLAWAALYMLGISVG